MNKQIVRLLSTVGLVLALSATAASSVMQFETTPHALPSGTTYEESGMVLTSYSDSASVGYDPLTWNPTGGALYFASTGRYVEFRMADQSRFNLNSFDFMTNGYTDARWIETSTGWSENLPGVHLQTFNFSGPNYSNIDWFRVG